MFDSRQSHLFHKYLRENESFSKTIKSLFIRGPGGFSFLALNILNCQSVSQSVSQIVTDKFKYFSILLFVLLGDHSPFLLGVNTALAALTLPPVISGGGGGESGGGTQIPGAAAKGFSLTYQQTCS